MTDRDELREKMREGLNLLATLNGGRGPVVPPVMAHELAALGLTAGYIEAKPLPEGVDISMTYVKLT